MSNAVIPKKKYIGKGKRKNKKCFQRNAVKSIINDQELKHSLIKKGRENIKKYEVQNIVNKYHDLYEKMMEK